MGARGGTPIIPTNLNRTSQNAATATAMEGGAAATGITGLTSGGLIDFAYVQATGHQEFRLKDRVRLGQNDAIAIEYDEGTTGDFSGVIFGYFVVIIDGTMITLCTFSELVNCTINVSR